MFFVGFVVVFCDVLFVCGVCGVSLGFVVWCCLVCVVCSSWDVLSFFVVGAVKFLFFGFVGQYYSRGVWCIGGVFAAC